MASSSIGDTTSHFPSHANAFIHADKAINSTKSCRSQLRMKQRAEHAACLPQQRNAFGRLIWRTSVERSFVLVVFVSILLPSNEVQSFSPLLWNSRGQPQQQQQQPPKTPPRRIGFSLFSGDKEKTIDNKVVMNVPKKNRIRKFGSGRIRNKFEMQNEEIIAIEQVLDLTTPTTTATTANKVDYARMSSFGALFSIAVLVLLSINTDSLGSIVGLTSGGGGLGFTANNLDFVEEQMEVVVKNVMGAALPRSATDVIAVALGEGIAGIIGAVATVAVKTVLQARQKSIEVEQRAFFEEAVADGDFFFTRAAAKPLLEAVGLPSFVATLVSVGVASVPYEIIKNRYRIRRENELEAKALKERQQLKQQQENQLQRNSNALRRKNSFKRQAEEVPAETADRQPSQVDLVESFSDVTTWLEYDVLKRDLQGKFTWNGQSVDSGIEGAVFGFLATLSSKLYADVLYSYFDFGPASKRKEVQERDEMKTITLYSKESLSAAALFGVYESVRLPVSQSVTALLSGGVDSCLGSDDFPLCIEVFMLNNPPDATWEGQLRSLVTALYSIWNRFGSEASLDSTDEFVRALVVQSYSFTNNLLGLEMVY